MKRSEINTQIRIAKAIFQSIGFKLPPFAFYSPDQWSVLQEEADEIRENGLGWDVTDYGLGDFAATGLLLFTLRNGNYARREKYPKGYAEKIMLIGEGQLSPMHFHWKTREDIINRGGGNLQLRLYLTDENENFSSESFTIAVDAIRKTCRPGEIITLTPGESICLEPLMYHEFYAETNTGPVVIGEVSDVNDDENDNRFFSPIGRFPEIIEDEPPLHLLCTEYP